MNLACRKPKELGYAAELWSRSALAGHVRRECEGAGFPALARAGKATVQRILAAQELQPHKVKYYLERRDPDFDRKMREVLLVYKEVELQNGALAGGGDTLRLVTAVVDEKPGKHPTFARDHEYIRLGTLSILAAMDLHDGHVIARVEQRHRSVELIGLLTDLDAHYPAACTIRLVLDNHSAHISRETRAYLATRPNRFKYVLTPTHGSWLNLAETLFGKMARTFLRGIRVSSLNELREHILKGVAEINQMPVVHRWKSFKALETSNG